MPAAAFKVTVRIRLEMSDVVGHVLLLTSLHEPRCENRSSGFPTRSDTNRAVLQQKMARGLKLRI